MAKINLLDSFIYNRISAGEVVERPASVVKELVENSLDAGATELTIAISGGGLESICITDNGSGIEDEDVEKAFLPHATSKICKLEDLDNILSLGFRGEALASISAVSRVKLTTKTASSDTGVEVEYTAPTFSERKKVARGEGTSITVNNLFYNTPARAKFMKKPKQEETAVTQLVQKLALANPNIAFTYSCDGKTVLTTAGKNLTDAIKSVYSAELFSALTFGEQGGSYMKISGYVGSPKYTKSNRNCQLVTLNGRIINNLTIQQAVYKGYGELLFTGVHPVFFLNITMPTEELDVNVTPNKADVRFTSKDRVFSVVYTFVRDVVAKSIEEENNALRSNLFSKFTGGKGEKSIENAPYTKQIDNDTAKQVAIAEEKQNAFDDNDKVRLGNANPFAAFRFDNENGYAKLKLAEDEGNCLKRGLEYYSAEGKTEAEPQKDGEAAENTAFSAKDDVFITRPIDDIKTNNDGNETKSLADKAQPTDGQFAENGVAYKVIGQVFNSFIVIEVGESVIFLDEHAANERLKYDELTTALDEGRQLPGQYLLLPYIVDLNEADYEKMFALQSVLNTMGFEFESFGSGSVKISSVPQLLQNSNIRQFITALLADPTVCAESSAAQLLHQKLATIACKASIKAGEPLSEMQIELMLKKLFSVNTIPLQCPHGRPTMVIIDKAELEKRFRRS